MTEPEATLKSLKSQRAGYRGHVTTLLNTDPIQPDEAPAQIRQLNRYAPLLQRLDDRILGYLESEYEMAKEISESCKIQDKIDSYRCKLEQVCSGDGNVVDLASQKSGVGQRCFSKLPKLNLENFSGDPLEWPSFYAQFKSAVHDRDDLADVDKMAYLKRSLDEEPAKVIKGWGTTNEHYQVALDYLIERYGQEHIIVNAHMEGLIDIPVANDASKLLATYDMTEKHLRGLEALGKEIDGMMMAPIIMKKLPSDVRLLLSRVCGKETWNLSKLRAALKDEVHARERSHMSVKRTNKSNSNCLSPDMVPSYVSSGLSSGGYGASAFFSAWQQSGCPLCDGEHKPQNCALTGARRRETAGEIGLCYVCLGKGHPAKYCKARQKSCKKGGKSHHVALCGAYHGDTDESVDTNWTQYAKPENLKNKPEHTGNSPTAGLLSFASKYILMKTAIAPVSAGSSKKRARILFDDASQCTYITSEFAKTLQARSFETVNMSIANFQSEKSIDSKNRVVKVAIHCRDGSRNLVEAIVVDRVAPPMYRCQIDITKCPGLEALDLADPYAAGDTDFVIDILIGGAHYYDFVSGDLRRFPGGTVATSSSLGWLLTGPAASLKPATGHWTQPATNAFYIRATPSDLDGQLTRLWELDSIGIHTEAEAYQSDILQNFRDTIRFEGGRYWVRFPWKHDKADSLPDNRSTALKRFRSLQRKLRRDSDLAKQYETYMSDQQKRGFIEKVEDESKVYGILHYIPHHPVVKGDSRTTKVRVVYDASARQDSQSISLNEAQFEGPKMIGDLFAILVRFRLKAIAVTSDIEKAFLQVGLQSSDRDCTRFFLVRLPGQFQGCRLPFHTGSVRN